MPKQEQKMPKIKRPVGRPRVESPMKNRVVRVDDETWDPAFARAKEEGLAIAEVVRHYLREYGAGR